MGGGGNSNCSKKYCNQSWSPFLEGLVTFQAKIQILKAKPVEKFCFVN